MQGNRYKGILFDMDGVITNTMPYHFLAWQEIFSSLGIELNKLDIYKREGEKGIVSLREILAGHGVQLSAERMNDLLSKKESRFKEIASPDLFPGIGEFIEEIKGRGYRLALVTGTSRDEVLNILPRPLFRQFDCLIAGDSVRHGKPSPEPYQKALEALCLRPFEAAVIENAPYGIRSAKEAGVFCIAVTTSLPMEYLKDADVVCDSLEEVRGLILGEGLSVQVVQG